MFDFLPDAKQKPNTSSWNGGVFSIGKNVFYDEYTNHLDAHKLISNPPNREQFNLSYNFEFAKNMLDEERIIKTISSNFYGQNTDFDKLIQGYTQFAKPEFLARTIDKVDSALPSNLFSGIEKPKMKINDKFGMFSYDLASMSMTYVYEYFDSKGNKVDANFVIKKASKFFFNQIEVFQKIKKRENGTPVVISSVRKCLIDFEKKAKEQRAVEIFVINSVAFKENADDFLYNSMASISVAKNLILKGFQVKVTSLLVVKNNDTTYYHFVPVKQFNQPLDINATAYVCGDPRFFRYQGFKMILYGYDRNNVKSPTGLGTIETNKNQIARSIESDYVKNSKLKQADTRLYFGNSRNLEDAQKEVLEAIKILNEKYGKN